MSRHRWLQAPLLPLATALVSLGCSDSTRLAAPAPAEPPSSSLEVVSFFIIEIDEGGGNWTYAPKLEVRESSGLDVAIVTQLNFVAGGIASLSYPTNKCVGKHEQRQLLPELYGDYELIFSKTLSRASSKTATAVIVFEDSSRRRGLVQASGAIVPGHYPTAYTGGGASRWGC